jgi:hypothetical protein
MQFVVSIIVPVMLNHITYGTYLYVYPTVVHLVRSITASARFFLMFMLMGIAFAIWVLPETFGKSLEEMVCGSDSILYFPRLN